MPYTKQDLQNLYSLSFEDVDATLTACGLSLEQGEYGDEQIQSGFDVIRKYFNDAQVSDFAAAAEMFSRQSSTESKSKKTGRGKKASNSLEQESSATIGEDNDLDISKLLAQATSECGTRISLTEAGKILVACDLPDKEEYSGAECDRFVEACTLVKQQGKTYEEVAEHFGVATGDNQQQRQEIIGEIQDMMKQATAMISASQAEKIQQTISKMTLVQLKEIRAQIEQQTALRLQEYIDSGRMERELQAAADLVINEPFLTWSPISEAKNRPLNGGATPKSLPGS